ncbi:DUF6702 family protein [Pedobacter sp. SYSU D00535]|uniref:DUF6702 family protein n=1 Tax=Pedobacter sp. SYSU D00535 TaxID=2810308 RepID=UPI001A95E160|nr:DUF6702 family protein [Pedobacter sp. SYSU D00535]
MLQLITSIFALIHPFFVSVTEIRHNEKTKSLEISSKLFFDDFEHALGANYKQKLDILNPSEKRRLDP